MSQNRSGSVSTGVRLAQTKMQTIPQPRQILSPTMSLSSMCTHIQPSMQKGRNLPAPYPAQ
jgi:hypothetical protein